MNTSLLRASVAALGLVVATSAAVAQTPAKNVEAGSYKVEPGHTQVVFSLLHLGFSDYSGMFSGVSGTLDLDPAHVAATKLNVTIPIDSVMTTSEKLTGELKAPNWFDSAQFPTATFVSTKVTPAGTGMAIIVGDLTLHGVTKSVTLHARYVGAGTNPMDKAYTVGFEATGTIKRSEFGVKTYVPMVGDDVTLSIAGAFEKQG